VVEVQVQQTLWGELKIRGHCRKRLVAGTVNSIVRGGTVTPLFEEEKTSRWKSVRGLRVEMAGSHDERIHIRSGEREPEK
jgi:hypothetical protein